MSSYDMMDRAVSAFEDMIRTCDIIKDAGACSRCPMSYMCIETTTFEQIACDASRGTIDEFFGFAKDIDDYVGEADYAADLADMQRKAERDEYYD